MTAASKSAMSFIGRLSAAPAGQGADQGAEGVAPGLKIVELIENSENPVMGLRIGAQAASPFKVDFRMSFLGEGQDEADDTVVEFEGFRVYVGADSVEYVTDAAVDYVDGLMGSGFKIVGGRKVGPELTGPVAEKVQQVIEERINPAVAGHGGFVSLIDVKDNIAYVQLGGGCQGCGMADVTLKQGIEVAIKEAVPEITEILDVTEHADGSNPYYQPSK